MVEIGIKAICIIDLGTYHVLYTYKVLIISKDHNMIDLLDGLRY